MNKYAKLREALNGLRSASTIFFTAKVLSVEGDTCTIELGGDKLDGVRLRPTECDITTKLLVSPKIGSYVLLGSQSGDMRDCNVLLVEEPETITIDSEEMNLCIDVKEAALSLNSDKLTIHADTKQGKLAINKGELGGLVKIKELEDNLKSIKEFVEAMHTMLPTAFSAIGAGTSAVGANGGKAYSDSMNGKAIEIKDMEDKNVTH